MNDQIPPNPYPVKPPADLPPPRKESLQAENIRLKAEVERLRKAGDAMYYNILTYKYHIPDNGNTHFMIDASILGWNPKYGQTTEHGEDKEGKQS